MYSITSHTIVKNGKPFIGKVLNQVAPYMDRMIIHLSCKSTDRTLDDIRRIVGQNPGKVKLRFENVKKPGELTEIRKEQVKETTTKWILFLDDDDYWPHDQLELCLKELGKDEETLAYSVNPYQLVDMEHYDHGWRKKSFSKFLRKEGLTYIKPWPKDLPADKDEKPLYWKTHPKVKTLPYKFYHLSYLKDGSFREEDWASSKYGYKNRIPTPKPLGFKIEL